MSVKFKDLDGSYTIILNFKGTWTKNTLPDQIRKYQDKKCQYFQYIAEPLETINIRPPDEASNSTYNAKCFTFFSHTEEKWRNFQAQLEDIQFSMNVEYVLKSMPNNYYYTIYIHSPDELPDFSIKRKNNVFNIQQTTMIMYSQNRI